MQKTLYLGMPGSGKTTTLLNLLEKELETLQPEKIAYVSFTKKAIFEAKHRAVSRFSIDPKRMPFFKTLHALAFSALGLSKMDVVSSTHLSELGESIGVDLCNKNRPFQPLSLYNLARVSCRPLWDVWQSTYLIHTKTWDELFYIIGKYVRFKKENCLVDFTDMLLQFNKLGSPFPVETAFVDEAQDLSTAQWLMLDIAFKNSGKLILAGDDDQCIYGWSGADKNRFMQFNGDKLILDKSYRCPQVVAEFANAISGRISKRYCKTLDGHGKGSIVQLQGIDELMPKLAEGKWLILVRNKAHIPAIKRKLMDSGLIFKIGEHSSIDTKHIGPILNMRLFLDTPLHWVSGSAARAMAKCAGIPGIEFDDDKIYYAHDIFKGRVLDISKDFRSYLLAIPEYLLNYYYIAQPHFIEAAAPRIQVSTIHGAKGAECDNVVLCCDQSILTYKSGQHAPDNEHRVFYVGATRTKTNLYLLPHTKKRYYNLPLINGV